MAKELEELAEQVVRKHNEALFQRLDAWLLRVDALLPRGQGAVPASPCLSVPLPPNVEEFSHASVVSGDLPPPASPLNRLNSSAQDRARETGLLVSMQYQENHEAGVEPKEQPRREWAARVLSLQATHLFFGLVVVSNSLYLGIQLEYHAQTKSYSQSSQIFMSLHLVYAVLFTVEVCLHLMANGFRHYLWSEDWAWNWLDSFVVVSSWIELLIDLLSPGESTSRANSNLRALRLLRVGRLFRVVRIIRVVKFLRSLRTLVHSLVGTLKSLFWALLLLSLIIYIFGILFTDVALNHIIEMESLMRDPEMGVSQQDLDLVAVLDEYWGTLGSSVSTLFQTISDGVTWKYPSDALYQMDDTGFFWLCLFYFYVAFCSFAVLNVMTGVFCNSAIKAAESDHEMVVQSLVQTRQELHQQVSTLFHQIDERGQGQITFTEFEKLFADDGVKAFFESLQIGAVDAWTLFVSLDKDGDHTISVDEFTERSMQLYGPAKSADLYALRQLRIQLGKHMEQLDEQQRRTNAMVMALLPEVNQLWHV